MADSVRTRGEEALLAAIRGAVPAAGPVRRGPGDDAAVIARSPYPLLLTTDALIEGVHFRRGWLSPRALGARAFAVNASDVAAMGGRAVAAVLAVSAPPRLPAATLTGVVRGLRDAARGAGAALAGGNLAGGPVLALTVALLGDAPAPPVGRDGGRPGDVLCVTGTLGGAALGLRRLERARTIPAGDPAIRRWQRPPARLRAGALLARAGIAAAMIDLSDGLLVDADRLCRASGVGATLRVDRLPLAPPLRALASREARALALAGGEDYELLFAVRRARLAALARVGPRLGCRVTEVGVLEARPGLRLHDGAGAAWRGPLPAGHRHFGRR